MVLFVWKFPYLTKPTNMHLCLFTCKVERVEMWMTSLIDEYMVIKLEWNAICDKRLSIKMRINVIRSKGMYWSVQWMLACSLFVRFLLLLGYTWLLLTTIPCTLNINEFKGFYFFFLFLKHNEKVDLWLWKCA